MKRALLGLISMTLLLAFVPHISAADFHLWKIGSLNTGGKQYNIWYYTGKNLALYGTTGSGWNVDIYVDNNVATVRAEDNGNWSYDPGHLADGNHVFSIVSGDTTYRFTLVLGNKIPDGVKTLPVSGAADTAIATGAAAMILLGAGYYLRRRSAFLP